MLTTLPFENVLAAHTSRALAAPDMFFVCCVQYWKYIRCSTSGRLKSYRPTSTLSHMNPNHPSPLIRDHDTDRTTRVPVITRGSALLRNPRHSENRSKLYDRAQALSSPETQTMMAKTVFVDRTHHQEMSNILNNSISYVFVIPKIIDRRQLANTQLIPGSS